MGDQASCYAVDRLEVERIGDSRFERTRLSSPTT